MWRFVSEKKCIFDSSVDCDRFVQGEYICVVFKERCENFKYKMSHIESESGNLISLTFQKRL